MKNLFLWFLLLLAVPAGSVFAAEVSEEQDIAIFGLTSYDYAIPDATLGYVDNSINNTFIGLKRFNVLGYGDYRIESGDVDEFIRRIREIRSEAAKEEGTYDEKFGTVVIKGEDFDRIVGSFLVVLPSLSNYSVSKRRTEVITNNIIYYVPSYEVDIVIDIVFVNVREGTQEESIRITGTGSDESLDRAGTEAVDSAISALSYNIRRIDMFKIKSGVIRVKGDRVFFELGSDIGVRAGDEYEVMTKQQIGNTGRIAELPTGLVRVKKVYPDVTEAKILMQKERITEGDQLVEVATFGGVLSFNAGLMKVDIPDMDYKVILVGDLYIPPFSSYYYINLDQPARKLLPVVGLTFEKSLGYRVSGIFDATAVLNFPFFGGIGELGVRSSFYKRRLSLKLGAQGGIMYLTSFKRSLLQSGLSPWLFVEGTRIDFSQDPVMNIYGLSLGIKGSAEMNLMLRPTLAFRTGLSYRLYTPIQNWRVHIEETSGGAKESVDIRSDSPNLVEYEESEGLKRVKLSGYEIELALCLRF